ncbi:MAG: [FeFe] hydrogenase H-cluster maturation GTPase HydF, partial [Bacilli bacterium]
NIVHITIFGNTNSGKSSLFNAIINQDIAVVDNLKGTTTDPVHKRIEFINYGPVLLTDTAGLDDCGKVGQKRIDKTKKMYSRTDFGIICIDSTLNNYDYDFENDLRNFDIKYIKVFTKIDLVAKSKVLKLKALYDNALFVNTLDEVSVEKLKKNLISKLDVVKNKSIIGKHLNANDNVVLVIPIDSEAPTNRLILPQVQVIRDLLDYKVNVTITNEIQLEEMLSKIGDVKLVITDSQAFHKIKDIVNKDIYLTSFSILFAHFKANLNNFSLFLPHKVRKVLICESCSHNISHEDIGRVKIPKLLKKRYGNITIEHIMGNDFKDNLEGYDLIVHCGSCMLNDTVMKYRVNLAKERGIPFINYGLYLAIESDILARSIRFFVDNNIVKY